VGVLPLLSARRGGYAPWRNTPWPASRHRGDRPVRHTVAGEGARFAQGL